MVNKLVKLLFTPVGASTLVIVSALVALSINIILFASAYSKFKYAGTIASNNALKFTSDVYPQFTCVNSTNTISAYVCTPLQTSNSDGASQNVLSYTLDGLLTFMNTLNDCGVITAYNMDNSAVYNTAPDVDNLSSMLDTGNYSVIYPANKEYNINLNSAIAQFIFNFSSSSPSSVGSISITNYFGEDVTSNIRIAAYLTERIVLQQTFDINGLQTFVAGANFTLSMLGQGFGWQYFNMIIVQNNITGICLQTNLPTTVIPQSNTSSSNVTYGSCRRYSCSNGINNDHIVEFQGISAAAASNVTIGFAGQSGDYIYITAVYTGIAAGAYAAFSMCLASVISAISVYISLKL